MLLSSKSILQTFKRTVVWTGAKAVEINSGNNRVLKIESGSLARFADGSATAKLGETVVLATVVSREGTNTSSSSFLPLTVDYRQRSTAAGLIPNTWNRRERGLVDREVLASRLIDRSVRPLFPSCTFNNDTQLICTTHCIDPLHNPLVVAINAASTALALSNIPWSGPVGAVQVGVSGAGDIIISPTNKQLQNSPLNLLITASPDGKIVMMDANGDQVAVEVMREAVRRGLEEAVKVVEGIKQLQRDLGRERSAVSLEGSGSGGLEEEEESKKGGLDGKVGSSVEVEVLSSFQDVCAGKLRAIFSDYSHDKFSRDDAVKRVRQEAIQELVLTNQRAADDKNAENVTKEKEETGEEEEEEEKEEEKFEKKDPSKLNLRLFEGCFNDITKSTFRECVLETGRRCDGRSLEDLRNISCTINNYPLLHGSSLFQRGQTQVLCSTTFGSAQSMMRLDPMSAILAGESNKEFFLHYEFPPYGTNEVGRSGFIGRRELGHGALAEKALKCVVPSDHPFTILLNAEVLESNGSSSMASVCAGSLALADAGVPITEMVSGVAMGLITRQPTSFANASERAATNSSTEEPPSYVILTDLMGIEDYMGDMDFKIASTTNGVTALQLDTKLPGLPPHVVFESIDRAMDANRRIIEMMKTVVAEGRVTRKATHPVVEELKVALAKRAKFLGIGGCNLRKIFSETGVQITSVDDETYQIFASNSQAMADAKEMIDRILAEQAEPTLDFGAIYNVRIEELKETGAMVVLHTSMPLIFIPNNQLDSRKVSHPSSLGLVQGQELKVKYFGRDPVTGKVRLSRKVLQVLASDIKNHL